VENPNTPPAPSAEDTGKSDDAGATTGPTEEQIKAMREKLDAQDKAFADRVASLTAEVDKAGPEGAQTVRLRCVDESPRLGVVLRRQDGNCEAQRLVPRQMVDFTLNPGDHLVVCNLSGDSLREFLRYADMAPAAGEQA
jgi:hypothetical protein